MKKPGDLELHPVVYVQITLLVLVLLVTQHHPDACFGIPGM